MLILRRVAALGMLVVAQAQNINNNNNGNDNDMASQGNGAGGGAGSLTLDQAALQQASTLDGSTCLGAEGPQAPSLTSDNNFINFCSGQTLTNGLQNVQGTCNGIPMGQIPSRDRMISSIITNPQTDQAIQAGQDFDVTVRVQGLVAGFFTNAVATYYSAPQQLQAGYVIGHMHITIQDMQETLNPTQPLDPTSFAFFKGINDEGNGQGTLSASVTGGLAAGTYRVCTLTSAANHQPVLMPVAQRGSQDDCTKFTVQGNGGGINVAANNGEQGQAAADLAAQATVAGPGAPDNGAGAAAAGGNEANVQGQQTTNASGNVNGNGQGQQASEQQSDGSTLGTGQGQQGQQGANADSTGRGDQAERQENGGRADGQQANRQQRDQRGRGNDKARHERRFVPRQFIT